MSPQTASVEWFPSVCDWLIDVIWLTWSSDPMLKHTVSCKQSLSVSGWLMCEICNCFVCGAEINACSSVFIRPPLLIDQSSAASGHCKYRPPARLLSDWTLIVNVLWSSLTVCDEHKSSSVSVSLLCFSSLTVVAVEEEAGGASVSVSVCPLWASVFIRCCVNAVCVWSERSSTRLILTCRGNERWLMIWSRTWTATVSPHSHSHTHTHTHTRTHTHSHTHTHTLTLTHTHTLGLPLTTIFISINLSTNLLINLND